MWSPLLPTENDCACVWGGGVVCVCGGGWCGVCVCESTYTFNYCRIIRTGSISKVAVGFKLL